MLTSVSWRLKKDVNSYYAELTKYEGRLYSSYLIYGNVAKKGGGQFDTL